MKPTTAEDLQQLVAELDLCPAADVHEAMREPGAHDMTAERFGQLLVRRELLTGFQLDRLLRGERRGYFYGRAKLLYQIGAGSFARVYRARERDTGAILAVKVLRNRFADDPLKRRAFQHEGQMGHLLRHPNIVTIEEVGEQNGAAFLTMEFIEGQTLRELVRIRGALDLPKALDVILQITTGLEYAHRRGVTHRDIKASNVLVSSTGQAKLVDFGLAGVDETGDKALGRMEKPRTIDYAALEKVTGVRDDSVRSDIYFLGTVAYLALAGTAPLTESRDRSVRSDPSRFTRVEPLSARAPDVPRDIVELVSRMMQLDPLERFQTAGDVRRAVESLIARHGQTAPEASRKAEVSAAPPGGQAGQPSAKCSLMLVEAGPRAQEVLRDFFTKLGYRVLLTENPQRALSRFSATPPPAKCLVLSAQTLGSAAVDAFNTLSNDPSMAHVPAILLTSPKHPELTSAAKGDTRRRVVQLPIEPRQMTALLESLVAG